MAKTIKKSIEPQQANKSLQTESRQELKQLILQLTEQRIENKFSDKNLDRENEKIKLISGDEISIKEYKDYISRSLQTYSPKFPKEYYREINRLNNWNKSDAELYLKPPIVGRYTNEIIYGRYSKDILPTLQQLNPYIRMGFRANKHFQWLTDSGQQKLEIFIADSVRVMKGCNDWYEFRVKYAKQFGVAFQLSCFEDNDKIM
jgi:hypothetical protein